MVTELLPVSLKLDFSPSCNQAQFTKRGPNLYPRPLRAKIANLDLIKESTLVQQLEVSLSAEVSALDIFGFIAVAGAVTELRIVGILTELPSRGCALSMFLALPP